jgi:hypothetical protein
MCQRFGCLPSQLYGEDPELLRMVQLYDLAHPQQEEQPQ